jgi:response regulator of citrate/malate metabolism
MNAPIRLTLVEDDPEVWALLHGYLCRQPELDCVLVADSVKSFLEQLPNVRQLPFDFFNSMNARAGRNLNWFG